MEDSSLTVLIAAAIAAGALLGALAWALAALRAVRHRADSLAGDAARLPDALARAERADAASERAAALEARVAHDGERLARLDDDLRAAREDAAARRDALEALQRDLAEHAARLRALHEQAAQLRGERDAARAESERLQAELRSAAARIAAAEGERELAQQLQQRTAQFLAEAQAQLRSAFTEAASKVFDEKALALDQRIKESGDASRAGLETTLKPFAEHIAGFQQRLEALSTDQVKARAELVGKISELTTLNQNMASSADALTRALKGNAKARGDWGELVLDTVLKACGLVEGRNYERQVTTRDEDGAATRPDLLVTLPDGRKLVVDSKVNLVAWADYMNTESAEERRGALQRHVAALRTHLRDLADRNYPRGVGDDALEITIAFVPIEGALSEALGLVPDLQTEAFKRKIAFATPNTLMAMLQVVERLWTRDRLARQVAVISEEAGKLLDTIKSFFEDFDKVESQSRRMSDAVAEARKRLRESPQSLLARTQRLYAAGARGKKSLPEFLRPEESDVGAPLLPVEAANGDDA